MAFTLQLAGLLAWSLRLFDHFDLQTDFAIFFQPWTLIARGTFNPTSTIHGYAFIHDHMELGLWPLSLLSLADPNGLVLLWLQDAALVAINVVTFAWVLRLLDRRAASHDGERGASVVVVAVGVLALALLLLNPGAYQTASNNVHLQAFGTVFLVLCAFDVWNGRTVRPLVWAGIALLFGGVFGTYLLAVGVSALTSRTTSRGTAAALAGMGVLWVGIALVTNSEQGSSLAYNYAYLAHDPAVPPAATAAILAGVLHHPGRVLHVLVQRWRALWDQISFGGVLGVVSAWGAPIAVIVLIPAALNSNPVFISQIGSFNAVASYPFVTVGTAAVLSWLALGRAAAAPADAQATVDRRAGVGQRVRWRLQRIAPWRSGRSFARVRFAAAVVVAAVLLVAVAFTGVAADRKLPSQWELVSGPASHTLAQVLAATPANAEVIAAQGVVGRFGGRRSVFAVVATPQAFPVRARDVVFVLAPAQGIETVPEAALQADVTYVRSQLHATPVASANGIFAFSWRPPGNVRSVVLTGGP